MSSTINTAVPADNSLLVSSVIRNLATAAKTDIEALQAQIGNGVGQGVSYFLTTTSADVPTYDVMSRVPDNAAETVESAVVNNNTVTIDTYIGEALERTSIPAGEWSFDFFLYATPSTGVTYVTLELYKHTSGGTETLLFSVNSPELNNTIVANYVIKTVQQSFACNSTDRLVLKVTATTDHNGNVTVSLVHSGTSNYSHVVTPLAVETSQSIGTLIAGSSAKTTPVGADTFAISDSADADKLKKFSFTNLATWLLTQLVGTAKALKSATTDVDVSAATAPTAGQILTATSGTAATWQTPVAAPRSATSKTADYSLLVGDDRKILVISGDSIDITLPASGTLTAGWSVTLVNENAFVSQADSATIHTTTAANTPIGKKNVLVSRAGSDLLSGASTQYHGVALIIPPKECVDIVYTSSGNFTAYPSTTVGWKDNPSDISTLGAAAKDPSETPIDASFVKGWEFNDANAGSEKEVYYDIHINHDYVMGTRAYLHVHGFTGNTTATTVLGIGFQYAVTKGHQQQALSLAGTTVYASATLTGTPYTHYVIEVSDANAVPATNLEPDSLISVRCFRDSANSGGSGDNTTSSFWMKKVDCHYLSTEGGTPLKAPPFFL